MSKKILIIDDEPDFVSVLKARLESNNFEVKTAGNGVEGLEKLKSEKPDLIILDIEMPEMDGYTFVLEFKKITDIKKTPIIILTAKEQLQDIFTVEGITDYFVKPFDQAVLIKQIKSYLQ